MPSPHVCALHLCCSHLQLAPLEPLPSTKRARSALEFMACPSLCRICRPTRWPSGRTHSCCNSHSRTTWDQAEAGALPEIIPCCFFPPSLALLLINFSPESCTEVVISGSALGEPHLRHWLKGRVHSNGTLRANLIFHILFTACS